MKKIKKILPIPKFASEDDERDFWATHDTTEYFDMEHPIKMDFSALKPSTKPITIRLPEHIIYSLKMMANKRDVPYQSFVKTILADRIKAEYAS